MIEPEAYLRVFEGHAEGALVLDDLVTRFDSRLSYVRGGPEADRETAFREGQRYVVRFILQTMADRQFPRGPTHG